MRNNIVRLGFLGILILVCIWQTVLLWLGETSSHNFLGNRTYEVVTQPKEIWMSKNGLAYNIEGGNKDNRASLIEEVTNEIKRSSTIIEPITKYSYAQLLAMEGVFYEYGTPLTLDEIVGGNIKQEAANKEEKYTWMFIDENEGESYRSYVYLINTEFQVTRRITLENQLKLHMKLISNFKDEEIIQGRKVYQASLLSANENNYFKGNIFYPVNNQIQPIVYYEVQFKPLFPQNHEEALKANLERYVNDLFKNPLYKDVDSTESSIVYTDNINLNVRYSKKGVLEFRRNVTSDGSKLSSVDKLYKVNTFIEDSQAIPSYLKQGVYLSNIERDNSTGETIYKFGYRYNNFDVILTEEAKEQLGIDSFLELVISGDQVSRGSWLMLEPEFIELQSPRGLEREAYTVISDVYELCQIPEGEIKPLTNLECAYIIRDIYQTVSLEWVAVYKDKLYYP